MHDCVSPGGLISIPSHKKASRRLILTILLYSGTGRRVVGWDWNGIRMNTDCADVFYFVIADWWRGRRTGHQRQGREA